MNVSNGVQVLEFQIPMMSAHLPAHNPSSVTALRLFLKTWVEKELIPKHLNEGVITSKPSDYN